MGKDENEDKDDDEAEPEDKVCVRMMRKVMRMRCG